MKRENLLPELCNKIESVEPYPAGVVPVGTMLSQTAFFPGGSGLWLEEDSDCVPDILVLGQDFSTVDYFRRVQSGGIKDLDCPTWRNLLSLFSEAGIDPSRCFFSNVYMGLRKEGPMTGLFPGARDAEFSDRSVQFLRTQIEAVRPSVIITLGTPAAVMMGRVSNDLSLWKQNRPFSYFDQMDSSIIHGANMDGLTFTCIRLLHPSFRKINVRHRSYKGKFGHAAEVLMLSDALSSTQRKIDYSKSALL